MNNERLADQTRTALVRDITMRYAIDIADSIQGTKCYERSELIFPVQGSKDTEIVFEETDSVSAVLKYAGQKEKTAVLNFASFTTPGGGFIYGAMAQEEALCMESTLYPVISDGIFSSYYLGNQSMLPTLGCLYSNRALYSPDIVFFRGEEEKRCDVITCAAPNASGYLAAGGSQKVNGNALLDRLSFIFDLAVKSGVDTLVLGAFGCGVFGQNPITLGALYNHLLLKKYKGVFDRVVIAVIDEKTLSNIKQGYDV